MAPSDRILDDLLRRDFPAALDHHLEIALSLGGPAANLTLVVEPARIPPLPDALEVQGYGATEVMDSILPGEIGCLAAAYVSSRVSGNKFCKIIN
jgi:hypothetical protein